MTETTDSFEQTPEQLLDSVERCFALEQPDVQAARCDLARLALSAAEAEESDLAALPALLGDLLTIADSMRDDGEVFEELVDFGRAALPTLREGIENRLDREQVQSFQQRADERWGDYLRLLSPSERCLAETEDEWSAKLEQQWSQSNGSFDDPNASGSGEEEIASGDVPDMDMLLSSLGELAEEVAQQVRPDPFATQKSSGLPAPPEPDQPDIDADILACYVDDAQQCLAGMERCLMEIENSSQPEEPLRQFCRELHTLKGASGTVGLMQLAGYLHELENRVETMCAESSVDVDVMLGGVDVVRTQLVHLSGNDSVATADPTSQPSGSRPVSTAAPAYSGGVSDENFVRIDASRLDRLMDLLAELVMLRNRHDTYQSQLKELNHELHGCANRIRRVDSFPLTNSISEPSDASGSISSGSLGRQLQSRTLSEMVNDVAQLGRSLQDVVEPLESDNSAVSHLIGRFRQELMDLRRLPVAGLFQRLQRAARDAARVENKQVELEFRGQGTRAERTLQERLFEPLMHLIRNGVSHGIESPAQREATGKNATGRIILEAYSNSSALYIEIRDDGKGLDEEALERRGRELGLLSPGQMPRPEQLWKLIFHPGFSTRQEVNEIAGRGVGMDVVSSRIRQLRGQIEVDSVPGQGTVFRLQVPLRSSIEHAMLVRVDGQLFALPMQSVYGTGSEDPEQGDIEQDCVPLRDLLGLSRTQSTHQQLLTLCHHAAHGATSHSDQTPVVNRTQRISISVDSVIGVEEVVVRSLPPLVQSHELFAGVTLSGHAETVLLFDVPRLVEFGTKFRETASGGEFRIDGSQRASDGPGKILVVDDSLSVRRHMVRKLEQRGYQVEEASDGMQALDQLRSGDFTGVVTDLDMPRLGGAELLAEIKRRDRLQNLPVIVVTSRDDPTTRERLQQLGARQMFTKPVTATTIARIITGLGQVSPPPVKASV